MIYLRPNFHLPIENVLNSIIDEEGWFELAMQVQITEKDFEICDIKINDVIYKDATPAFWETYNKIRPWHILSK